MADLTAECLRVNGRLRDVTLRAPSGQVLGLIGPNGAGKSTLLMALAGLLSANGSVRLGDTDLHAIPLRDRARRIGYLPQQGRSAWALTVHDVVALGRLPWQDQDEAAIDEALQATGVEPLRDRPIDALSGGEQARVWLARVLAGRPDVLLADEPLASLDLFHQQQVAQALRTYASQGHVVVLAIHDLSLAARYCDRLMLMQQGQCVACGTVTDVLTTDQLSAVYGVPVWVDLSGQPPVVLAR